MAEETVHKIAKHFTQYRKRIYDRDQIIIHGGDEPQYVYYLVSGKVRQYDISKSGDEVIVSILKPGAFFPMQGLITGLPNKYFFTADSTTEVRLGSPSETMTFMKENNDVMLDLLTRVYTGVDGLLGRMVQLMCGNAQSRLLYELVIECQRFGEFDKAGSCFIAANEGDLAARAGLSRETVSREMQKLIKRDMVYVSHSGIIVRNLKELEEKLLLS